ncbi:hypothetical protein VIMS_02483 [Mycobacterium marinum]|nr:hypothetical protein VIMS_02483 [Mycobacterium marinum]
MAGFVTRAFPFGGMSLHMPTLATTDPVGYFVGTGWTVAVHNDALAAAAGPI